VVRLLLDTHALVWWLEDSPQLSKHVAEMVKDPDNQIFVSAVSAYEATYKYHCGKWPEVGLLVAAFEKIVAAQGFDLLPLTARHAIRAGTFPREHRDPFDRMLAAQVSVEGLALASRDGWFRELGVEPVWG